MADKGWFKAQIYESEKVLRQASLFDASNRWVTYPPDLPSRVRDLSYLEEYQLYQRDGLFDIALVDHAILQFKYFEPELSYCYYQMPFEVPTYADFLHEMLGDLATEKDVGDEFKEEYELAIQTAALRDAVTPIRYDYSPELYEAGIHPAAHVHIGSKNEIRLATRRILKPLSFVLFVVRQMYPDAWRTFLGGDEVDVICRAVREDLAVIDAKFLVKADNHQLILE